MKLYSTYKKGNLNCILSLNKIKGIVKLDLNKYLNVCLIPAQYISEYTTFKKGVISKWVRCYKNTVQGTQYKIHFHCSKFKNGKFTN